MRWSVQLICVMTLVGAGGCAQGLERSGRQPSPVDAGPGPDGGLFADASAMPLDGGPASADGGPLDGGPLEGGPASADGGPLDGGPLDGGPLDGGPLDGGPLCGPPTLCAGARGVGGVTGDQGSAMLEAMGTGSEWLTVTVRDTGSTWNGDSTVRARLELQSLGSTDYDLVVYRAAASMTPMARECAANESVSARPLGESDELALQWPDTTNGLFANDGDGRILSVFVRHGSGPCDGPWRLVVTGNR